MMRDAAGGRHRGRGQPPRGRDRGAVRDRHEVRHAHARWPTSSCGSSTSSRTSRARTARRRRSCPSRSSATTAAACTATSRCGRTSKPLFAGDGYAGMSEIGAVLHRRHPQARARDLRVHEPDHEQLPPARAGLRGAGQPRVLLAQPLGVDPHPDVLAVAEGAPDRGALPGPVVQPVPRVRGDDDGGPRRHGAARSTRAIRSTRTSTRSAPRS